jgi:hypothetical protein
VLHELYNYDDLVEVEEDRWERRAPTELDHQEAPASPALVAPTVPPADDTGEGKP